MTMNRDEKIDKLNQYKKGENIILPEGLTFKKKIKKKYKKKKVRIFYGFNTTK